MRTIIAIAGLLLAAQEEPEWASFHGGPSLEGVADTALPDAPARLWEFKAGQPVEHPPVAGGGKIFVATAKNALFALDWNGRQVWASTLKDDTFTTPPFYSAKAVFLGTGSGALCAFDAATGRERWRYKAGDSLMGTANRIDLEGGRKGIILISQADGAVHCVDLETGKPEWTTDKVERCDGHPSVGSGRIVLGSCASALHVYTGGKEPSRKDIPLGEDGQVAGGVALSGKTAYAGTRGGKVHAVDVEAGKILWKNDSTRSEAFTTPAVNDRFVVFGAHDGKVYGLDRATGAKVWEADTGDSPSSPVIARDRVAVSSKGSLLLLDLATGKKVWSARVSDAITGPAVVRGRLIVGTDSGVVAAFGQE
jgi:outer membrane protein assembly factor BamB